MGVGSVGIFTRDIANMFFKKQIPILTNRRLYNISLLEFVSVKGKGD